MRAMLRAVGAGTILLAGATTVPAQNSGGSALQTFTRSNFYAGLIGRTLSSLPPEVFQRCPALVSTGSSVTVLKPVTFGVDGFPNGGAWWQRFPVSGCGNDTTLNIYFFATSDEKIDTVIGVPGDSHADPVLQRDATTYAAAAVRALHPECERLLVKTARYEGRDLAFPPQIDSGREHPSPPWWETWTLVGCGRTYQVPMDFIPDATGTQVYQPAHIVEK